MMKKLMALLLTLAMLLGSAAMAENASWHMTVTLQDANGVGLAGATVTLKDEIGTVVMRSTTNDAGKLEANLPEGIYRVKALDAEGYAASTLVGLYEDREVNLVIRHLTPGSEVTVGTLTQPTGSFATDLFSNNTSDVDVRHMIHGYSTVAYTSEASYTVDDSVVTLVSTSSDGFGNKLYRFKVADDLLWSDGKPVTNKDYVFSVLMQASPEMLAIGGAAGAYWHLLSSDQYTADEREHFVGVHLLDNNEFSLTIRTDALPYFYELTFVNVTPYPMHVIAPGCDIADEGRGAFITGGFNETMLAKTMLGEDGYIRNPKVTCGAYLLDSYDAATGTVVLKANPNYKGNFEGARPLIETVTLKTVSNSEILPALADGSLDIVNKITDKEIISAGSSQVAEGTLQSSNYLRSGLGFMSFVCEQGPTASERVRKAVSYCLDQPELVQSFVGVNGSAVYSWYGLGQWMVGSYMEDMADKVTTYPFDTQAAVKQLVAGGYNLNEEGKTFRAGTDTVRYRLLKGNDLKAYREMENPVVPLTTAGNYNLLPLTIKVAKVPGNRMAELLAEKLYPVLREVGFDVQEVEMSFTDMLSEYYRETPRTCNMYLLATNFTHVFDPLYTWNGEEEYQGVQNTTGISDGKLVDLARRLRGTTPGDNAMYLNRWERLMARFTEVLPAIPLYSNIYYDFFSNDVQGYTPNAHWSWGPSILYTWVE